MRCECCAKINDTNAESTYAAVPIHSSLFQNLFVNLITISPIDCM